MLTKTSPDIVLLTGLSGFIAKHVALRLLIEGYRVRGTVRSAGKGEDARRTLHGEGVNTDRLEIVEADLTADTGWDQAVAGCRYVQHTASPFPGSQPKNKYGLVPAAKGGTLRVIEAAKRAGVERVVLTSSVAAILYGHGDRRDPLYDETDFSDVESRTISPYAVSKTLAERAAWDAVAGGAMQLAVINPSLVLGPLLDRHAGTSASLVAMMMRGRIPALPDVRFGLVDVRDVAEAHLRAMEVPEASGHRFIASAGTVGLLEIAAIIAEAHPEYRSRLPTRRIPDLLVRTAGLFSSRAAMLAAELGAPKRLATDPARAILGLTFRPPEEAVLSMAASLIRMRLA